MLISLIGTDSITFNRAFAECGLAATTLRLAGAMDETVLLGIGADNTENLFCASGYFTGVGSRANDDFLSRYHAMFGANAPPIGRSAQSNYEGLRFLQAAAERAGSLELRPLLAAGAQHRLRGARGPVAIRDGTRRDADVSRRGRRPRFQADQDFLRPRIERCVGAELAK